MPLVSIIIVNYNAGKYIDRCIESVLKQSLKSFEVIVVDNASTDNSLDLIPDNERINIIKLDKNVGFARANNIAAKQAKGAWIALLNPDAFPKEDWLDELVNAALQYPDVIMFGSTQLSSDNPDIIDGAGDMYHILGIPYRGSFGRNINMLPCENVEVFAPCAAAALYRKDVFLEVSGFDEKFFCYCEDVDLAFRLRLLGHKCVQVRKAIVLHKGSGITSTRGDFSTYYGVRNRNFVFIKNMPAILLIPLLPLHILAEIALLFLSVPRGNFVAHFKGFIHSVTGIFHILTDRRKIQTSRTVSIFDLAKTFILSPLALFSRKAKSRKL